MFNQQDSGPSAFELQTARIVLAQAEQRADAIVRAVAELPDRTSPEDWPEVMLVTADELHSIIVRVLGDPY